MIKEIYNVLPLDFENLTDSQYRKCIKAFNGYNVVFNDLTISEEGKNYVIEKGSLVYLYADCSYINIKVCNNKTIKKYILLTYNEKDIESLKECLLYLYNNFRRGEITDNLSEKLSFLESWSALISIIGFIVSIIILVFILYVICKFLNLNESISSGLTFGIGIVYFISGLIFGINHPDGYLISRWKKYDEKITEYAKNHTNEMFVSDYASEVPLLIDKEKNYEGQ